MFLFYDNQVTSHEGWTFVLILFVTLCYQFTSRFWNAEEYITELAEREFNPEVHVMQRDCQCVPPKVSAFNKMK